MYTLKLDLDEELYASLRRILNREQRNMDSPDHEAALSILRMIYGYEDAVQLAREIAAEGRCADQVTLPGGTVCCPRHIDGCPGGAP